ncbi:MAG: PLD nuclease N-terminal domain-containing protein, partial [Bulleidia sp.]
MKKLLKILTSRLLVIIALIALQIALLFSWLWNTAIYLQIIPATEIFGVILAIYVINQEEDPSYKLSWCVMILTLPLFGSMLYLLVAGRKMPKKLSNGTTQASSRMKHLLKQDETIMEGLKEENPPVHNIFNYALRESRFPVFQDTDAVYFPSGEKWFPV